MSKVSIIGAYNTKFGAFVERNRETGEVKDIKSYYDLLIEAGINIEDIDFAEVHDCFTINQILSVEALGLSKDGQGGWDFIEGKYTSDDDCPINLSGGLKSKGHPVGATGASMHRWRINSW